MDNGVFQKQQEIYKLTYFFHPKLPKLCAITPIAD